MVMVLGLGRSGMSVVRSLTAGGANIIAWDDNEKTRARAQEHGVGVVDPQRVDWSGITAVVPSPGISISHPSIHPLVCAARNANVPILGDIELFARTGQAASIVGITGTNGKSTTTALIGHILEQAGRSVRVGGNFGTPVLDLEPVGSDGVFVLELSSFQLDLTESLCCDVASLLNLSPDHLDRHGSMSSYVTAKKRIFSVNCHSQTAVVGIDDKYSRSVFDELTANEHGSLVPISVKRPCEGVYVLGNELHEHLHGEKFHADLDLAKGLPGTHNMQNAAAAYAAARVLGICASNIVQSLNSYGGLPHRLQEFAQIRNVRFVNDSKATNASAASRALECFENVFWIAGGRSKQDDIESVWPYLEKVRHVFLIGEAADKFAYALAGRVPYTLCGDLEHAVVAAFEMAQIEVANAVVLLAPACSSYDQWLNFEERGEAFQNCVERLSVAVGEALI